MEISQSIRSWDFPKAIKEEIQHIESKISEKRKGRNNVGRVKQKYMSAKCWKKIDKIVRK